MGAGTVVPTGGGGPEWSKQELQELGSMQAVLYI